MNVAMGWAVVALVAGCGQKPEAERESAKARNTIMQQQGARCDGQVEGVKERKPCERACLRGHSNSCFRLGLYWTNGIAGPKNAVTGQRLLGQACEGGSGLGCAALGESAADTSGLWRNARLYARVHCEQGHGESCHLLGVLARAGRGGARDPSQAAYAFGRACKLGHRKGCSREQ